ncbi:hypothetical protein ACFWGC_29160 [Cytobacillus pseudoceanisediminis]|uniref:hypothetical protein n=1 Tax=Cytobacillus pseudoceanisediminis TaxID=3051614 RepID=UPI00364E9B3A
MSHHNQKRITEKDKKIYGALYKLYEESQSGVGPSQIGISLGRENYDASSYCNLSLKKLIEFQLVKKLPEGKYIPSNMDIKEI